MWDWGSSIGYAIEYPVSFPLTSENTPCWRHFCSCFLPKFSRIYSEVLSFYISPLFLSTLRKNKTGRKERAFWQRSQRQFSSEGIVQVYFKTSKILWTPLTRISFRGSLSNFIPGVLKGLTVSV